MTLNQISDFENYYGQTIRKHGVITIPTKAPIAQKLDHPAPNAFAELLC
jgi:hypothetical protein